jgi:hypothetical protein
LLANQAGKATARRSRVRTAFAALVWLLRDAFERLAVLFHVHELTVFGAAGIAVALHMLVGLRILHLRPIVDRALAMTLARILRHENLHAPGT